MDALTHLSLADPTRGLDESLRARLDSARGSAAAGAPDTSSEAWKAAQEFEGLLLGQLFQTMFAGVDTTNLFGGGHAEKMWRGLMIQEIGNDAAAAGGFGIADMIYRDMVSAADDAATTERTT
jgi:Rod binding domain-containing protein